MPLLAGGALLLVALLVVAALGWAGRDPSGPGGAPAAGATAATTAATASGPPRTTASPADPRPVVAAGPRVRADELEVTCLRAYDRQEGTAGGARPTPTATVRSVLLTAERDGSAVVLVSGTWGTRACLAQPTASASVAVAPVPGVPGSGAGLALVGAATAGEWDLAWGRTDGSPAEVAVALGAAPAVPALLVTGPDETGAPADWWFAWAPHAGTSATAGATGPTSGTAAALDAEGRVLGTVDLVGGPATPSPAPGEPLPTG